MLAHGFGCTVYDLDPLETKQCKFIQVMVMNFHEPRLLVHTFTGGPGYGGHGGSVVLKATTQIESFLDVPETLGFFGASFLCFWTACFFMTDPWHWYIYLDLP